MDSMTNSPSRGRNLQSYRKRPVARKRLFSQRCRQIRKSLVVVSSTLPRVKILHLKAKIIGEVQTTYQRIKVLASGRSAKVGKYFSNLFTIRSFDVNWHTLMRIV
jgi:hypothetical protein